MDKYEFIKAVSELLEETPVNKIDSLKEGMIVTINNVAENIKSFKIVMGENLDNLN